MSEEVDKLYGNRLRVRACGVLADDNGIVMVNHRLGVSRDFWAPPGGGVRFREPAVVCVQREFKEETGLDVEVDGFLFACEFIQPPLHAIELYFRVHRTGGELRRGQDPEMSADRQILREVKILSWQEISAMSPTSLHGMFGKVATPAHILQLKGYINL